MINRRWLTGLGDHGRGGVGGRLRCATRRGGPKNFGLPELDDRLASRRNRSLYSRLGRRLHIAPLTPEDATEYLRLRLERAGCEREVFPSDSNAMLHEAATGALRDIDRLTTAALREAARKKKKLVERDILARVLDAEASRPGEEP